MLLATSSLSGAERIQHETRGVICDADADISEGKILQITASADPVLPLRRSGTSINVELVRCAHARAVRPDVSLRLWCRKCLKLGNTIDVCLY